MKRWILKVSLQLIDILRGFIMSTAAPLLISLTIPGNCLMNFLIYIIGSVIYPSVVLPVFMVVTKSDDYCGFPSVLMMLLLQNKRKKNTFLTTNLT